METKRPNLATKVTMDTDDVKSEPDFLSAANTVKVLNEKCFTEQTMLELKEDILSRNSDEPDANTFGLKKD